MIETFEQLFCLFLAYSLTAVDDFENGIWSVSSQGEKYLTAVGRELEGIGKEVGHHLVEMNTVNPYHQVRHFGRETYGNFTLFGTELVKHHMLAHKLHKVCLGTMQVHLLLVYLALVEYLVDQ